MDLFSYINPIQYYTDVNSIVWNYYNSENSWFTNPIRNFGSWNLWNLGGYNNTFNIYKTNFNNIFLPYNYNIWHFNNTKSNYLNTNPFGNINSIWDKPIYNFTGTPEKTNSTTAHTSEMDKETTKNELSEKTTEPKTQSSYIGTIFATNAKKYLGFNESDGSFRKFSDSPEWCADFVTYIVNESYKEKGLKAPTGFGSHSVENLKQWGIDNNKYLSLTDKNNKAEIISNSVKIGDILILRENNASHTGIVSKINSDGSFEAIEGNRGDKVAIGRYTPNDSQISGFVQLS